MQSHPQRPILVGLMMARCAVRPFLVSPNTPTCLRPTGSVRNQWARADVTRPIPARINGRTEKSIKDGVVVGCAGAGRVYDLDAVVYRCV
jgi:hypothetical protein